MNKIAVTKIILLLFLLPTKVKAQHKHALLIAIANYPDESGWGDISSDKDIDLIKPVYLKQGFNDMQILRDEDANKDGIMDAFKKLRQRCKPGDVVIIHYSGHGQQIADDNGDEPDGLDEAFVAYGAPSEYMNGYAGEKHLRDDELGHMLDELRMKVGKNGHILVLADACHSGTISRGMGKKRGGKAPLVPPGFESLKKQEDGPGYDIQKTRGSFGELAPIILFSASSFDEENTETFDDNGVAVGSLSYAMAKGLSNCKTSESYRTLFSQVLNIMNEKVPQQTPMIEGDLDIQIFGGNIVRQLPYFAVKEIETDKITIHAGTLLGITEGSKMMICPSGSLSSCDNGTGISAQVIKAGAHTSVLKPQKTVKGKTSEYWVFLTEPHMGSVSIKYKLAQNNSIQLKTWIDEASANLKEVKQNPDIIITEQNGYLKIIRAADGRVTDSLEQQRASADQLKQKLISYAQCKYLRELKAGNASSLSLEFIPCNAEGKAVDARIENNMMVVKPGEYAKIKVINKGTQRYYFNIIDIQPDGKINPIIPAAQELTLKHAEQYLIEAESEKVLPITLEFAPPFGKEVFKLFASVEPFNLTPYFVHGGIQTRGAGAPLEKIFIKSNLNTRGASASKSGDNEFQTGELIFKIDK